MRISIEMMLETIMLAVGCLWIAQMISCNVAVLQARSYFYQVSDQIEYSQNDNSVISKAKKEASDRGYRLETVVLTEGEEESCLLLSLYYPMQIPILSKNTKVQTKEGVIQGYAR